MCLLESVHHSLVWNPLSVLVQLSWFTNDAYFTCIQRIAMESLWRQLVVSRKTTPIWVQRFKVQLSPVGLKKQFIQFQTQQ